MSTNPYSAAPVASAPAALPPQKNAILFGPNGLRAGWRIAIFFLIFVATSAALNFVLHHIPAWVAWGKSQPKDSPSPAFLFTLESMNTVVLLIVAFFMTLIEKRSFADYYLPWNQAFGKRFWQGLPYGFAMLSLLIGILAAFHAFSIVGIATGGTLALKYGLLYGLGFIAVGMFEEFGFRGYLLSTLGSGIGFWWAALVMSLLFGGVHIPNGGESWFGAAMAGSFGLLAAFALYRTGTLWFPIGMHAAWDWGETYFYGVADSGLKPVGNFLNSTQSGNHWISGGSVGPEGSIFALVVLAIGAVGIHFLFPTKQVTD
jgi:membrane protease YdiL (CAAX protease family)